MPVVSLFKEGRFQQAVFGPKELVINPTLAEWGGEWAAGALDDSWWFYGQARKRPAYPAAMEGLTLRGVRPGSTIRSKASGMNAQRAGAWSCRFSSPARMKLRLRAGHI